MKSSSSGTSSVPPVIKDGGGDILSPSNRNIFFDRRPQMSQSQIEETQSLPHFRTSSHPQLVQKPVSNQTIATTHAIPSSNGTHLLSHLSARNDTNTKSEAISDPLREYFNSSIDAQHDLNGRRNYRSSLKRGSIIDSASSLMRIDEDHLLSNVQNKALYDPVEAIAGCQSVQSTTSMQAKKIDSNNDINLGNMQNTVYSSPYGYNGYGNGLTGFGGFRSGYGYGMGQYDDGSFFSQSVETLNRFAQLVDMNSWFFDQICDTIVGITSRIQSIRSSLKWLPQRLLETRLTATSRLMRLLQRLDLLVPPELSELESLPNPEFIQIKRLRKIQVDEVQDAENNRMMEVTIYKQRPHRYWTRHFEDTVKRLRLSISLCICFLLFWLWRLFLFWRRRRRKVKSRTLLWEAFFGPSSHHMALPSQQGGRSAL